MSKAPIILIVALMIFTGGISSQSLAAGLIVDHTFANYWQDIPDSTIANIIANNRVYYVHTSHGSQINSGSTEVNQVDSRFPDINYYPNQIIHDVGDDLGYDGDTSWAAPTRSWLNSHPECNIVMYSWCGGASYNTESGINIYLNKVSDLEDDYPNVTFVYMTGHLDGTGPSGNLYIRNNQIRDYCSANGKVLFDFADIESWDPDGNYYPNESDACNWCDDWCDDPDNECDLSCYCAHSHCFNCFRKSCAWWVMMSCLEGINPVGIDDGQVDLPTKFNLGQNHPNPFNASTTIKYSLPYTSKVIIDIFNLGGAHVETLINERQPAGYHQVTWKAGDVASGVYLYKIQTGTFTESRKMILVK
ncbi:MAG: T9SS type A sorting domain-containing protein [candidate division Zixibacteria bacterium]|nr:T9SS type A sorting domain-containing protein [candidate division Zixibacteria bacterium]